MIRIVDDELSVRESLEYLLSAHGWKTAAYESAEDFIREDAPSVPGCIILDVRMPGMSGLKLQDLLNRRGNKTPIIFLTGHGDIEMAVESIKAGADDFLPKTADSEKILQGSPGAMKPAEYVSRFASLTEKEKEVARLIAKGVLNREIAGRFGVIPKTIYGHRVQIFRKLAVRSSAEISQFIEHLKTIGCSAE